MQTQQPGSSLAKVEVVSVLGFACVLRLYSCSALHSYNRKRISFPAPKYPRRSRRGSVPVGLRQSRPLAVDCQT
jgi:hypothetical protein